MSEPDGAFRAVKHARRALERAPYLSPTAAHVLLVAATFGDGRTGANIRPSTQTLAGLTGYSRRTIARALAELQEADELIRVNGPAHRGSAACYRLNLTRKAVTGDTLSDRERVSPTTRKRVTGDTPPLRPEDQPSGPSGPAVSDRCHICRTGEPIMFVRVSLDSGRTIEEPVCQECAWRL
jgi:DNA-binding MarR family transcriptional regulator